MKKTQSNYLNMGHATLDVFKSHTAVWQGNELLSESVDTLTSMCGEIDQSAAKQETNKSAGHTATKEEARTQLEDTLYLAGTRLRVYARKTGDQVTASQMQFSRSALDDMPLNGLLAKARMAVDVCAGKLEALEAYQIDQALVDSLQESINLTADLNAHRDAVIDHHTENTSRLKELFSALRKELKLTDDLVEAYVTDKEFLTVYFNARRIHDLG